MPKASVSTDDAYVQADSSTVAPKVGGLVAQVLVDHNQPVRAGQPLLRIDPETFDARVASARADLETAQAQVLAARAAFSSLDADEKLAAANVETTRTAIAAAEARHDRAEADRARFEALLAKGFATRADVDRYRAEATAAGSEAEKSRAALEASRRQAGSTSARASTLSANLAQAEAGVARAKAALALAQQDQAHAVVVSPIDGVVGDRQVQPGDYVQPGTRLMSVVPVGAVYVTANFKETQVARMTAGQAVTLKVDALPGRKLTGRVESFAPGSGSQFSLLPFEPGTGNFTKVVQRVPVRIRLDPGQPGLDRLRPGLSTTVRVALK
jgi:membrane fusion protein (multidrug efflux system)